MANVSEWSANELENLYLDDMSLSDERGRRAAKIMAAVKAKEDEQDAKLDAVAGGLVFRGTKSTYADLEAVEDPAVGDMYSVTGLGGENYAWNGEAWDVLGTSDANVVHKSGTETITGQKTLTKVLTILPDSEKNQSADESTINFILPDFTIGSERSKHGVAGFCLYDKDEKEIAYIQCVAHQSGKVFTRLTAKQNAAENPVQASVFLVVGEESATSRAFRPDGNGTYTFGTAGNRWGQIYSSENSISTSDERCKRLIDSLPDKVLDAWGDVSWVQFKMADAVEAKGEQSARLHTGLVAQQIDQAFKQHGLSADGYGLFCWDAWDERPEERDASGNVVQERRKAGEMYSLRYVEALAMEAAFQRRKADRLEARIEALEAKLNVK